MNLFSKIAGTAWMVASILTPGFAASAPKPANQPSASWQAQARDMLPLLGHRNWILVVDSAYPWQISPGVTILETNQSAPEVLRTILGDLHSAIHVSPVIYTDAELPFVPENEAPGITRYRNLLKSILAGQPVRSLPHQELLKKTSEAGQQFRILVLKTTATLPYTSVFLQLDCKYWTPEQEQRLRQTMASASRP